MKQIRYLKDYIGEQNLQFLRAHFLCRPVTTKNAFVKEIRGYNPVIYGRSDVKYVKCSDEHGVIEDLGNVLKVGDKLRLVPGHCDPTCNVHDWYVGVRNGTVECVWPISARGKGY